MVDPEDEDTIEIQLAPSQLEALIKAAEAAEREASNPVTVAQPTGPMPVLVPATPQPIRESPPKRPATARRIGKYWYLAAGGAGAILVLSATIGYQLGARARAAVPSAPLIVPNQMGSLPLIRSAEAAPVIAAPEPAAPPFQYRNPFDPSETFEFPAGTSETTARDAVAELLLRRAQERQPASRGKAPPTPSIAQRT